VRNALRILLFIESSRAFGQGLLRGIAKYSRQHGPWMFYRKSPHFLRQSDSTAQREMQEIQQWKPHAAIYWPHSFTPKEERIGNLHLEKLFSLDIPIVVSENLVPKNIKKNVIDIGNDTDAICKMAAQHLLERGLQNFAFCGYPTEWSRTIGHQFGHYIKNAGFKTCFYESRKGKKTYSLPKEEESLAKWIQTLPQPCGIMALNDDRSQDLIEAANIAELQIPQEIAVLGVDNDEFICDMCFVPLSSIMLNTEKAGYTAAKLLHQRLSGQEMTDSKVVISPVEVVCRQSTDIVATDDEVVADAVRFIRNNAHRRIPVDEVSNHVGVSRRALELRFRKALHCSINQEIMENRVQIIEDILLHSSDTISQIAYALDFDDVKSLSDYFYRVRKIRPMAWRKKYGKV
jgi:LacI family transcriptional regulator